VTLEQSEREMSRVILWDFDGTLAERPGRWSGCLLETLDVHADGHGVTLEDLRPFLRNGFPWDRPDTPHHELSEADAWWAQVEKLLRAAYEGAGIESTTAGELARLARARYVDPSIAWRLFPDVAPTLERLRTLGWSHVVLSNHVPELPAIAAGIGLTPLVDRIVTSAAIGFEKPHPEAFAHAFDGTGRPADVWMVGDNEVADVAGAEAVGIPAILVRREGTTAARRARDLLEAAALIEAACE
jgi:putative hydrolase of the HAD superfamily